MGSAGAWALEVELTTLEPMEAEEEEEGDRPEDTNDKDEERNGLAADE